MSKLSKALKKGERAVSNAIPHEHSADRRAAMYAAQEQMEFYKQQKEELRKAREDLDAEKKSEADQLHQQQIRAMRGKYRRTSGFMGTPSGGGTGEVKDKLG